MAVIGQIFRDSTPPNPEFRIEKKTPPRQVGDLSNAIALVGRVPFRSAKVSAVFFRNVRPRREDKHRKQQQQATSKQQQQAKHIAGSEARLVGFGDLKPGLVPAEIRERVEKCAISPARLRLLGEARSS